MDTSQIFSSKAQLYARYRWDYTSQAIEFLLERVGAGPTTVVADIGAGTGILTRHFIGKTGPVYAVEINAAMRQEAAQALSGAAGCTILDGRAEDTHLPAHSVDLITVAQAIHWFDPEPTRREFRRILKPGGWLAVLSNGSTDTERDQAVAAILTPENGVKDLTPQRPSLRVPPDFYYNGASIERTSFPFTFREDWQGFFGALCSTSFTPDPADPAFPALEKAARAVFERFSQEGWIEVHGETELILGQAA